MAKEYHVRERVWRWPGQGGWHFVTLPKDIFAEIRSSFGKGMVPIQTKGSNPDDPAIPDHIWDATLFPHMQSESYILAIRKSARSKLQVHDGDLIQLRFTLKQ